MDIQAVLQRHEVLKRKKEQWYPLYQALAHFVLMRKQYFTRDATAGPFLLNRVFDSTADHALHSMASSVLGQIWPNPFESFEFVPQVAQDEAVYSDSFEMMSTVNEILPANLALPEAGVMTAFHEAIIDAGLFGDGAIYTIETGDYRCPVKAKSIDAKTITYAENEHGQVDTVYMEKIYTLGQLVKKFGEKNVSAKSRTAYRDPKKLSDEIKVLHVIEPRLERNPLKLGNQDMAFASFHIEIDEKHVLLESGFNEMPVHVFRFWKSRPDDARGWSPAMTALADIRALNKLVEMFEKAGEMGLDPPKMVSSEDVLGAGKIPWGPGVSIPVHMSGRLASAGIAPIQPIMTTSNPSWAIQRMQDLRANIQQYFMLDILSDLSNTSRQTLGEANIRNELRQFMVGPHLIRILLELVTPFLDRSFNILLQMGLFGVIRGSVQDAQLQMQGISPKYISEDFISRRTSGLRGYRINFINPAARLMKLEESQGLNTLTAYTLSLAQVDPNVVKTVKWDEAVRTMQKLSGASQKVMRSPAEVLAMIQAEAEMAMQQQQLAAEQQQAASFKDAAKGVRDLGFTA